MSIVRAPGGHPPLLPPDTLVGNWRVVDWHGQGGYGAVYRAVSVGQEDTGPVALKLSVHPWNPRFAREVELLSRIHHPNVPRLLGHGLLRHASGAEHPYFVMEWVDGMPLYAWGAQHDPSSPQVLLLLAQLARALAATHAAQAVHRDVKGDNVLVRHSDGQAVLIDFGSGHFQGATRLTWQSLPPHTASYRSAQACLFHINSVRDRDSYYEATPADDVFALGVTAYRLVMGEYPPPMEPQQDEAGCWYVTSPDPRILMELNPRVEPRLRELILRMLSAAPEARGKAEALAEALEAAASQSVPVRPPDSPHTSEPPELAPPETVEEVLPESRAPRAPRQAWRPWLTLAAAGVAAAVLWASLSSHVRPESGSSELPDASTNAVGDTAPIAPLASVQSPPARKPIAQDPPPEPRQEQIRPDRKGRCPGRTQVAINGGCWVEHPLMTTEACKENGYVLLRGRCYAPALGPPKKSLPTSSPSEAP